MVLAPQLEGASVAAGASLSHGIYDKIRGLIVSGDLAPGTTIHEPQIAAQFGVSRTPVREALLRLRSDGLVIIKKQSGTFVAPIDPLSVEEGILVRGSLEPQVAEVAANQIQSSHLSELEQAIFTMRTAATQDNQRLFIAADDQFHRVLNEASGFPHVADIIGRVNAHLDRVRFLSATNAKRAQEAIQEHQTIIDALRDADGKQAAFLIRLHLEASWIEIRKIVCEMTSPSED